MKTAKLREHGSAQMPTTSKVLVSMYRVVGSYRRILSRKSRAEPWIDGNRQVVAAVSHMGARQ